MIKKNSGISRIEAFLKNKRVKLLLKWLPILVLVVFGLGVWLSGYEFTVEGIMSYVPENYFVAAAFLILLYALKSMSVFLPIVVLYLVGGAIFPPFWAIFVNMLGTAVCIAIPYWLGYFSGQGYGEKLLEKHPKIANFMEKQHGNELFISYFLRVISLFPGDIISLYLGSIHVPFYKYMLGGMLGVLPGVASITIMGSSITDPTSPIFIASVVITVIISTTSLIVYLCMKKAKKKAEEE